jgi:hypothetical protein
MQTLTGFTDSTDLLDSPEALRRRADEDGFLFFKRFLPTEPVLELRRQILEVVRRHGWIKSGSDLMDGLCDMEAVAAAAAGEGWVRANGLTPAAYAEVQKIELFHALPHHPKLIALYETIFGCDALPHPRHIARVLLPAPGAAPTPPHQDYIYIQGTHQFWTCWFPLGDCPIELGGLSILRGSHQEAVLDVHRAQGAGGFESILCNKAYDWIQDNYQAGDIVTFPSHTLHKGLKNQLGDRVRLSCDLRYQPAEQEIEEKSLVPHMMLGTWEDIYAGWKNPDLKYYWQKRVLKLSPWNPKLLTPSDRIC